MLLGGAPGAVRTIDSVRMPLRGCTMCTQVSLPIAQVGGCPVGLGLRGPPNSDERLLEVAEALMAVLQPAAPPSGAQETTRGADDEPILYPEDIYLLHRISTSFGDDGDDE